MTIVQLETTYISDTYISDADQPCPAQSLGEQLQLGRRLLAGAPSGHAIAFSCFVLAARSGDAEALNLLGRCYEKGWGTQADAAVARHYYRRAAEAGDHRGAFNYGCLISCDGCISGALHWLERALEIAPDAFRTYMLAALSRHPHCAIHALTVRHS